MILAVCSLTMGAVGQEKSNWQSVQAQGDAVIKDDNLARAQMEAIENALRNAVEKAVMQLLSPDVTASQAIALQEAIYSAAEKYIQTYKIIAETPSNDAYLVSLKAVIDRAALEDKLRNLGIFVEEPGAKEIITISMTVRGIRSYPLYQRFMKVLRSDVNGIREVRLLSARQGTVGLDIDVEGSLSILIDKLGKTGQFSYNLNQTGENELEMMLLER
ncbi:MAG: flagellar assembly protein T N-terminal domain-containing protein [Deltaproteobacteria bacterium]|nr:flagellar assembly protein T N-terminal domain-containing protein [Deltaproteobacteria bacterium]